MIKFKPISMRASLIVTILIMGVLSITYSILTANFFQKYTLENRGHQLSKLAELEVHNLRDKAVEESVNLGVSIQSSSKMRTAIKFSETKKVVGLLNDYFHRAFVTLGILELEKLIVFDEKLNYLYSSSEGVKNTNLDSICPGVMLALKQRKGLDLIKPFHKLCVFNESMHLISMVPIGGIRVTGYLAVVVNLIKNLIQAEKGIGYPLKVESFNNTIWYESNDWPSQGMMENVLIANYGFKGGNKKPIASFSFAFDIVDLKKQLDRTRTKIFTAVSILTLLVVAIALFVFQRSILCPLNKLSSHLHRVKDDKSHLGEDIKIAGSKDIVELANDFNEMSRELKQLYSKLETMAFTDSLTGIPNRALLLDRLDHLTLLSKREKNAKSFIFMLMDLNRFKQVNDNFGHNIGDLLLQEVAERLKLTIRESDTVARLGGDEFAIILNGTSDKNIAIELANKISSIISEKMIIEGRALDVGISIGISLFPESGVTSKNIIHCADDAMYYAKKNNMPYSFCKDGFQ